MSDMMSNPTGFRPVSFPPSARSGLSDRASKGFAAATLVAFSLNAPITTSPILVRPHSTGISAHLTEISPAAFTAAVSNAKTEAFSNTIREVVELSNAMVVEGEGDEIDLYVLQYAVQSLSPFIVALSLAPPIMLPLRNGGIGAEWHDHGMNIELRFRRLFDVYAVVEDIRGIVPAYHGRDPLLRHADAALREFHRRAIG